MTCLKNKKQKRPSEFVWKFVISLLSILKNNNEEIIKLYCRIIFKV